MPGSASLQIAGALFTELHVYRDAEARSAAMNMALDEALLDSVAVPTLRFYRWRRPSLSFGYFGRYADVVAEYADRELVRRWTGGGVVLHGDDLTYSVIIPSQGVAPRLSSRVIYTQIHEAIGRALATHVRVELARENAVKRSEACFANPVTADVLLDGEKIAGAAHRRTRAGLLHQGSIQYEALPAGFEGAFASALSPQCQERAFTVEMLQCAESLVGRKYGTANWMGLR